MTAEAIIREVFLREPLWNHKNPQYRNKDVATNLWEEIGELVGLDSAIVKTKWKGLRDYYRVELKKMTKSGVPSSWPHFELLSFLRDSIKKPADFGNRPPLLVKQEEDDDVSMGDDQEHAIMEPDVILEHYPSPRESPCSTKASHHRHPKSEKRHRKRYYPDYEVKCPRLERMDRMEEEDDDLLFLKSLLPDIRSLPRPRKVLFRLKVQELVYNEVSMQDGTQGNATSPSPQSSSQVNHQS